MSRVQAELILGRDPRGLPLRSVPSLVKLDEMYLSREVMAMARKLTRERKAKAD